MSSSNVALHLSDLTKRYGDLTAVDRLSIDVRAGEILGFLGPNGAGKTTTLKMLCGLLRPDSGRIELHGRPLGPSDLHCIGVSPQELVIWETLTCFEQLEFVGRIYDMPGADVRRSADALLDAFGLREKRNRLARTLSGGMQRRLNIALALVHRPSILLLDEPQAGLDPQSRVLVRDYVRALAGETTVVVTTHDMEEAEKLSDRVCIIDHGALLVLDTVAEIKKRVGANDIVELEIDAEVATELLPHVPGLDRLSPAVAGRRLTFAADGNDTLGELLRVIRDRGLTVEHLHLRKTTLEDVFIHLTGRGLRE